MRPSSSGGKNTSNCPRTRRETYPRIAPACAPTALRAIVGLVGRRSNNRCASGSISRWSPATFCRIQSPLPITHARERNPVTVRSVNPATSSSARRACAARSSRIRARSSGGTIGPGPATRLPICSATSQSARRAAWEPIDQSTSHAGSTGRRLALARSLLAGSDHGGTPGFAFGDTPVGPLCEELLERLVEGLLIERHLRATLFGGRRGGCGRGGGFSSGFVGGFLGGGGFLRWGGRRSVGGRRGSGSLRWRCGGRLSCGRSLGWRRSCGRGW